MFVISTHRWLAAASVEVVDPPGGSVVALVAHKVMRKITNDFSLLFVNNDLSRDTVVITPLAVPCIVFYPNSG